MHEGFVGRQKAVSSREQVTLQHSFHGVFAEHFHDAAVGSEFTAVRILGEELLNPEFLADRVNRVKLVGRGFIRTEDAEVVHIQFHHVAQEGAERGRIFDHGFCRLLEFGPILAKIRQPKSLLESSPVGMKIRAHSPTALRRQLSELRRQLPAVIERVLWLQRAHPSLKDPKLFRVLLYIGQRHLVSSPETLQPVALNFPRSRPTLGDRNTIIGQRCRSPTPCRRAAC